MSCNMIERCCFVRKHKDSTSALWRDLVETYCFGPLFPHCERRRYFERVGECAPDDMTPTGALPPEFNKV